MRTTHSIRIGNLNRVALALGGMLLFWIALAPAEARLGNLIKLVYVHGALVMVGLATFSVAGLLGLVALIIRRPIWYRGTRAAGIAALIIWVLYVISAVVVTGLAWGQWIAWNEPRVRATFMILLAAVALALVIRLVAHPTFTALVHLAMGVAPWIVTRQAEVIRHPVDPIGGSESATIQIFYLLIVLTVAGLAATLIASIWLRFERDTAKATPPPVTNEAMT